MEWDIATGVASPMYPANLFPNIGIYGPVGDVIASVVPGSRSLILIDRATGLASTIDDGVDLSSVRFTPDELHLIYTANLTEGAPGDLMVYDLTTRSSVRAGASQRFQPLQLTDSFVTFVELTCADMIFAGCERQIFFDFASGSRSELVGFRLGRISSSGQSFSGRYTSGDVETLVIRTVAPWGGYALDDGVRSWVEASGTLLYDQRGPVERAGIHRVSVP